MPLKEYGNNNKYFSNQKLPHNLEHKPVYAMPYSQFDGMYANDTDCQYLSIGMAQWDNTNVSLKTMRHTEDKWSRQSEELPLHRVIDSTIFLSKILFDNYNKTIEIERNTFQNQNSGIQVIQEQVNSSKLDEYENFLEENKDLLNDRFNSLYNILDNLKKKGKF